MTEHFTILELQIRFVNWQVYVVRSTHEVSRENCIEDISQFSAHQRTLLSSETFVDLFPRLKKVDMTGGLSSDLEPFIIFISTTDRIWKMSLRPSLSMHAV